MELTIKVSFKPPQKWRQWWIGTNITWQCMPL